MRPPIHLTFEAIVALASRTFERLPDGRDPNRLIYPMRDTAMSALACFFFQDPSLLALQRRMQSQVDRNNLETAAPRLVWGRGPSL